MSDYSLIEDDIIYVQVQSENQYGLSELSEFDVALAKSVETVPHKPVQAPTRGSLTSQTQIQLIVYPFEEDKTGGSQITSYQILWD